MIGEALRCDFCGGALERGAVLGLPGIGNHHCSKCVRRRKLLAPHRRGEADRTESAQAKAVTRSIRGGRP